MTSRRARWLAVGGAVAVLASGVGLGGAEATPSRRRAKNIILLIGDGMGVSHIEAARLRYEGAAGRLDMETLPQQGQVTTYAVQAGSDEPEYVTDSASSATAWASGVKTYNFAIGKDAYGNVVPTIMEQAAAAGLATGNVSTAEMTDATPAAMFSHVGFRLCQGPDLDPGLCGGPGQQVPDRPIAEQIATSETADVILGGGMARFEPEDQDALEANGYTVLGDFGDPALAAQNPASQVVASEDDLAAVEGPRVVGLFNRGNMTIEKFKRENPDAPEAAEPSLAEMTDAALALR